MHIYSILINKILFLIYSDMSKDSENFLNLEDPFIILNLDPKSDLKSIRERYFFLSSVFHPDKQSKENY